MIYDEIVKERFHCKRGINTIIGLYCHNRLSKYDRKPVIIFSHGFAGNMYSCEKYSRYFCNEGYVCVFPSFCGGGSVNDPMEAISDGDSCNMTISTEKEDLIAVIKCVKKWPEIDPNRIILFGESQGGLVSALVAAEIPREIHRLIMVYPAFCIPDHARKGMLAFSKYDPENVPEKIELGYTTISKKYHDDVVNMDPYKIIGRFDKPVLIIHGDKDKVVNVEYSRRAWQAYGYIGCRLLVVRNMKHEINNSQREIIEANTAWFLKGAHKYSTCITTVRKWEKLNKYRG